MLEIGADVHDFVRMIGEQANDLPHATSTRLACVLAGEAGREAHERNSIACCNTRASAKI